jgi:broad specificity phosphatase PhoE
MGDGALRTRLILVRHGATEWTAVGRYQGSTVDIPLSADGLRQARSVALALEPIRVARIACSPLRRAVETATCIAAARGLTTTPIPAFRELSFGEWEGLTSHEASTRDPDLHRHWKGSPDMARPPGGEMLREAHDRAIPALDALVAEHAGKKVVLVTHNLILRVLLCRLLGAELSTVGHMRCEPGSISIADVREGRYVVRVLNDTGHLRQVAQPGPVGG